MPHKLNPIVGIVVVIVCLAIILVVYHFTVGAKVSREAPNVPSSGTPQEPPGGSHARPAGVENPQTKPAREKPQLPPGQ